MKPDELEEQVQKERLAELLKRPLAYVAVLKDGAWRIAIAVKNEPGCFLTNYPIAESHAAAEEWADELNRRLGLTPREAILIILTTLRGGGDA